MTGETKNNSHPEGSICEQFGYISGCLPYPNSSDIKELGERCFRELNRNV